MSLELCYWILMLLWFVLGLFSSWPKAGQPANVPAIGGNVLLFLLFLILGWSQFGQPIK